jgi:hypothetical protein
VDLGHRLGPGGVEPDGVAGEDLLEVGPGRVEIEGHVGHRIIGRSNAGAEHGDRRPRGDLVVDGHDDRRHRPRRLGDHVVVHLHRLDHRHDLARPHHVAHGHPHLDDEPLQGRGHGQVRLGCHDRRACHAPNSGE